MTCSYSQRSIANSKYATSILMAVVATIVLSGCSRAFFREQADEDAAAIIAEKAEDLDLNIEGFQITPHDESRMFDAHDPDFPPMPPDDPNSPFFLTRCAFLYRLPLETSIKTKSLAFQMSQIKVLGRRSCKRIE